MSAPERLIHLLELADQGSALRAALAEEVAELLMAWPADCPADMRASCETLLARTAREVDPEVCARLRRRLDGDPQLAARVLPGEPLCDLTQSMRRGADAATALAQTTGLGKRKAAEILAEPSGHDLAVACKGAGIGRAAFSAITVLSQGSENLAAAYSRLDVFDAVPMQDAQQKLHEWREKLAQAAE